MGNAKYAATRMAVSIGVAVLVVSTVVPAPPVSPAVRLAASTAPCTQTDVTCALILGTSGVPTPDDFYVESVKNQFIAPTHPGQIDYVKVTTPEELWPLGGLGRLVSLLGIGGDPQIFGPGGPAWDLPWWKLAGLFELTFNQSILHGVTDLEQAIAEHPNDHRVIFGYSQSAVIANRVKQRLAEQYPAGTTAPDIDFVLGGDLNLPNGGLLARFPGLYIPILDWYFNGPAPTDTPFDTVEIARQYDFMADFPLYPLNLVADLNALLGFFYVHLYPFDVSLAPDPSAPPPIHSKTGDTDYYFFPTEDLPLFAPLRSLGVPESVIDVVEPFFRVLVDLGYDRSIPPWEPTPARLIPPLNPATVAADLVTAIGEGINNAAALIGLPPLLSVPAAPDTDSAKADVSQQSTWTAGTQQMTSMVERNPADGNPADDLDTTFERIPADGIDETASRETSGGTQQTTSRGASSGTQQTATSRQSDQVTWTGTTRHRQTTSTGTSRQSDQMTSAGTTRHRQTTSTGTSRQSDQMTSAGTTRHRQTTSTGGSSSAPSSSAGSSSTGNSSRGSANGDAGKS